MDKSPAYINTEKETRSFFWFMTLILVGLSVWLIIAEPGLKVPKRLIPYCLLMVIHILLHWSLRKFADKPGWTIGYVLVQGLLTVAMILIVPNIGLTLGLSMALVGEAIGVYGLTKRGLLAVLFYLILSLGFFIWLSGISQIGWWLLALIPMIIFVVIYVEMYSRQAKANERAQELLKELETANCQLTDYAAQVEDLTIAAERQRMARELHDTLSQDLAGMILQLEAVDANLANGKTEKSRQIVQHTMESARKTLSNARLAIDDLRHDPSSDCEKALQQIAEKFSEETNLECVLETNLPQDLSYTIIDAVSKITTEALTNISRHANATRVTISAALEEKKLLLEIIDNGNGFNPSTVPETGHYGLIGMHERARLVGGHITVTSEPGQGTTISIRIPLS